ncbi:hypothetical protein [Bradyrhizobium sp. WSM1743]|uniref:hypothetical protein n=1 Tax=Bradyrhizobium sp. WSM1743 TaxID=318996 RepID=UPI000420E2F4|nr:hypothetical protein [Bradyrhizobium sp. WSM1743]
MGNRAAKFISTLVASIIAGAPLAAVSQNAPTASSTANAAADCLAAPKDAAPQGQHWYYRLDRTTKRKCWYLRAAGDKDSARTAQTTQATSDTPAADAPAPQQQHAVQDARAEYLTPRSGVAPNTPNAPAQAAAATPVQQSGDQVADGNAQQPAGAAPWPDVSTASAPPAPPPAPTVVAAAAQPSAKPSKSPSPVALATADSATDKPTGSVQMLMLVIGGALALAGILASLIYRFAGARVRLQSADRHAHWGDWEAQNQDGSRAPWLASQPADVRPPRPVDFDAARPQPTRQVTKLAAIGREIDLIEARKRRAAVPAAEPVEIKPAEVEIKLFDRAAAPKLAADEIGADRDEAPAGRDQDAVDVDLITTMLEQLAKEGPRLSRPNLEADLANFARSLRGQSAARA